MPIASGVRFGPYHVQGPLGRGGMASVFKAHDDSLDRYVALKILPAEFLHEKTFAERFSREARVIAHLEHPNIVPIHAFGIEGDIPWMAMRLVLGGSLAALLHEGRIALPRCAEILKEVAAALDYSHARGVIHRDVKPQNILLDESGHAYLADFGIARILEGSSLLTQTGQITGTPQYMAPEIALGKPPTAATDIYSLGVVAYEMSTGRVPFIADTPVAVLVKHVSEPIPRPAPSEVPPRLASATLRCLEKKPEARWPSAGAFAAEFEQAASSLRVAPPPPGVAAGSASRAKAKSVATRTVATPFIVVREPITTSTLRALRHAGISPPVAGLLATGAAFGLALAILVGYRLMALTTTSNEPRAAEPAAAALAPGSPSEAGRVPSPALESPSPLDSTLGTSPASAATPAHAASPLTSATAVAQGPGRPITPLFVPPAVEPEPVAAAAAPTPAAPAAHGTLQIDVDAVRDADDETTATLYLRVEVDGRAMAATTLAFSGTGYVERSKKRALVEVRDVPVGARRVLVLASAEPQLLGRRAEGSLSVNVAPGTTRLSARLRYLSDTDREVRLR